MKKKKSIGTTFKKENIFLATVDYPLEQEEAEYCLEEQGFDFSAFEEGDSMTFFEEQTFYNITYRGGSFIRQEFDIFYKGENSYIRFWMKGNEIFAGDGSDGKEELHNIVSAWKYYQEEQLFESVNDKGEPVICDRAGVGEDDPLERYNQDYNLKSD